MRHLWLAESVFWRSGTQTQQCFSSQFAVRSSREKQGLQCGTGATLQPNRELMRRANRPPKDRECWKADRWLGTNLPVFCPASCRELLFYSLGRQVAPLGHDGCRYFRKLASHPRRLRPARQFVCARRWPSPAPYAPACWNGSRSAELFELGEKLWV